MQGEKVNTINISIDRVKRGTQEIYIYIQSEKRKTRNISLYRVKKGTQEISL